MLKASAKDSIMLRQYFDLKIGGLNNFKRNNFAAFLGDLSRKGDSEWLRYGENIGTIRAF